MAIEDVTPELVNLITYNKYTARTANTAEFEAVREMQSVYINSNTSSVPDRKFNQGLGLLIAHYYALDDTEDGQPEDGGDDLSRGPLIEEKTGDITVKFDKTIAYSNSESSDSFINWLTLTTYGRQYLYLMKTFKTTPRVT